MVIIAIIELARFQALQGDGQSHLLTKLAAMDGSFMWPDIEEQMGQVCIRFEEASCCTASWVPIMQATYVTACHMREAAIIADLSIRCENVGVIQHSFFS